MEVKREERRGGSRGEREEEHSKFTVTAGGGGRGDAGVAAVAAVFMFGAGSFLPSCSAPSFLHSTGIY